MSPGYRAEGKPFLQSLLNGPSYVWKSLRQEWRAPKNVRKRFEAQRLLLARLRVDCEFGNGSLADSVRLAFVGDIMHNSVNEDDFVDPVVLNFLNGFDVVLGNLETPISPRHPPMARMPMDFIRFNSSPGLIDAFRRANGSNTFRALSVANNHSLDMGEQGLADTLDFLNSRGILSSGAEVEDGSPRYVVFESKGIKFGFYAATWGLNDPKTERDSSVRLNFLPGIKANQQNHEPDLSEVREVLQAMEADQVDFRIVSMHWGYEYEFYPTQKIINLAGKIVRAGADLIVGSHPHVQQPNEIYFVNGYETRFDTVKPPLQLPAECCLVEDGGRRAPRKSLVAYSAGNFTSSMATFFCRVGLIESIHIRRDPETARVDWFEPDFEWVYNPRNPVSPRKRLVMLDDHLRLATGRKAHRAKRSANRIEKHLSG